MITIQKQILVAFLINAITLLGCQNEPPDKQIIDKAKFRVNTILDSLSNEENIIITDRNISEEFFDDRQNQYVVNYIVHTGLDSNAIIETEASLFIVAEKNEWLYNFSFNQPYRGKITN